MWAGAETVFGLTSCEVEEFGHDHSHPSSRRNEGMREWSLLFSSWEVEESSPIPGCEWERCDYGPWPPSSRRKEGQWPWSLPSPLVKWRSVVTVTPIPLRKPTRKPKKRNQTSQPASQPPSQQAIKPASLPNWEAGWLGGLLFFEIEEI